MDNASKSCLSEAYKNHWYTKPFKLNELPLSILKTIYDTLFLPHLYYGILLWGSEIESIHKLQKRE